MDTDFERRRDLSSSSATDRRFKEAVQLHKMGRLTEAQALYDEILLSQPRHHAALHLSGVVALQSKQHLKAVSLIGKAIGIFPNNADYYLNRGVAFQELGRLDCAVGDFDAALALRPDLPGAHYNKANALMQGGRAGAAISSYDAAIALNPNFIAAHSNRGNALQSLQRWTDAVASYDEAIRLKPDHAQAHCNRGNALQSLKQFEAAVVSYDRAIASNPTFAEAYHNRGNALRELEKPDAALTSYDKAIELRPAAETYVARGAVLRGLKQFEAAIANYNDAIKLRPSLFDAHFGLGNVLMELRRGEAAVACYDQAILLNASGAEAHANRGYALHALKRFNDAVDSYDRAIALSPHLAEAHFNRANALQELKRLEEAVAGYKIAVQINPDYAEAHCNLGNIYYFESRRPDLAAQSYQRCMELLPDDRLGVKHLLAGIRATEPIELSQAFLTKLYQERAEGWDSSDHYRGHEVVSWMLLKTIGELKGLDVLDAGCGTGLVGSLLKKHSPRLSGVDVSPEMLRIARDKNVYRNLYQEDLVAFMIQHPRSYDAVVSAATLIHFRNLQPIIEAAAIALRPNGMFVFTVFPNEPEAVEEAILHQDSGLARGGCFSHSASYVRRLSLSSGFAVEAENIQVHEYFDGRPIMCHVFALRSGEQRLD